LAERRARILQCQAPQGKRYTWILPRGEHADLLRETVECDVSAAVNYRRVRDRMLLPNLDCRRSIALEGDDVKRVVGVKYGLLQITRVRGTCGIPPILIVGLTQVNHQSGRERGMREQHPQGYY
jgi:hypothetical protein